MVGERSTNLGVSGLACIDADRSHKMLTEMYFDWSPQYQSNSWRIGNFAFRFCNVEHIFKRILDFVVNVGLFLIVWIEQRERGIRFLLVSVLLMFTCLFILIWLSASLPRGAWAPAWLPRRESLASCCRASLARKLLTFVGIYVCSNSKLERISF